MRPSRPELRRYTVAAALLCTTATQAATLTFDTPTTTTAETMAAYGLFDPLRLEKAVVVDGELRLYSQGSSQNGLDFGRFDGDVRFEFDARIDAPAGYVNVGFQGASAVYIHPGYWDHWYGPGLVGRLGFVPGLASYTHFTVDVTAATKTFEVTVEHGGQRSSFSFVDAGYSPGLTALGFSSGMVTGVGYYAAFDNLSITTVPEPATVALWGLGLLALAARGRRRVDRA